MKQAIILHGKPSKQEYYDPSYPSASNSHWIPWLQKELLTHDIAAHTPEMPNAYSPNYSLWSDIFERYDITKDTVLVGHSCGAGFLIRWLSEHTDTSVDKVVLVAPWLDPDNKLDSGFFDFSIDRTVAERTKGITIFNSTDDGEDIQKSVAHIRQQIDTVQYKEFENYGHFCLADMKTTEFPELLDYILK